MLERGIAVDLDKKRRASSPHFLSCLSRLLFTRSQKVFHFSPAIFLHVPAPFHYLKQG